MREYNITVLNVLNISAEEDLLPFLRQEHQTIGKIPNDVEYIRSNHSIIVRMHADITNMVQLINELWQTCYIASRVAKFDAQVEIYEDSKMKADILYREWQTLCKTKDSLDSHMYIASRETRRWFSGSEQEDSNSQ